jgi:signal transduction histidine kinase
MAKAMQSESGGAKLVGDDIPEAQMIVDAINQLQVHIRTLLSDRTQMLAAISHDLRTPITRLKLRAESLDDKQLYRKILGDLSDMEHMINSVLSFVQSDSEELAVKFDLAVLLETVINDMQDAGFSVHYESTITTLPFLGQIKALKRAFSNLLDNAVKYGAGAVLNLSKAANEITVTIDDHGPGIPEHELQKVFQPFYRLDETRNKSTGGTGRGLVIVKNILVQHQGDIQLINLPKGGLRVQITFNISA